MRLADDCVRAERYPGVTAELGADGCVCVRGPACLSCWTRPGLVLIGDVVLRLAAPRPAIGAPARSPAQALGACVRVGAFDPAVHRPVCPGDWRAALTEPAAGKRRAVSPRPGQLRARAGYRIELAAAEPLIRDPVAIAFDERGRMFVVENRGYPGPLEGASVQPAPEGVIARLEDVNGDGRFDTRTEFATGLAYPNGIMPWNGGVFVTSAPDLLYLKDTNGDGVADERRVVLTGFDATRTAQIRFSHPTLGIDNWVYLTSGLTGGSVTVPDHPDRPAVTFGPSDSRFNPSTLAFELTGGQGQFGLTFDDYGRRFTCSNRRPVMHAVLEPRYLEAQSAPGVLRDGRGRVARRGAGGGLADQRRHDDGLVHSEPDERAARRDVHRGQRRAHPSRRRAAGRSSRQHLHLRVGPEPGAAADAIGERRDVHVAAGADRPRFPLVARHLVPAGVRRERSRRRPLHRRHVPQDHRPSAVRAGSRAGRCSISRRARSAAGSIGSRRADWKRDRQPIDLGRMSADQLSRTLEHPNAWWRETAQRLLVERRDRRAIPLLRALARDGPDGRRPHPRAVDAGRPGRARGCGRRRGAATIRTRPSARTRVRLAEPRVGASPELVSRVLRLVDDGDDRVRFRVALALGETDDPRAIGALAAIARRDGAQSVDARRDPQLRARTVERVPSRVRRDAGVFARRESGGDAGPRSAVRRRADARTLPRSDSPDRRAGAESPAGRPRRCPGSRRDCGRRGLGEREPVGVHDALVRRSPQARSARARVERVFCRARRSMALDEHDAGGSAAGGNRAARPYRLRHGGKDARVICSRRGIRSRFRSRRFGRCRSFRTAPRRRAWWSRAAGRRSRRGFARPCSRPWSPTSGRRRCCSTRWRRGAVTSIAVGASRRSRLMTHRNAAIQTRARALFAAVESGDRMQVYERLRATVLKRAADAASGRQVFATHCAPCHAVDGSGRTGGAGPERHPQPASRRDPAARAGARTTRSRPATRPTSSRPATGGRWSAGWNRKRPTASRSVMARPSST